MARQIHLIVVGKLKNKSLEVLESDYLKRITNPDLFIHEIKASSENKEAEGEAIIKKIRDLAQGSPTTQIALTEWGENYSSVELAEWIANLIEQSQKLIFIIAGAEGFSESVLKICQEKLSLSKLTFPHKLARLLLVEQLYRAQTIRTKHPYHN